MMFMESVGGSGAGQTGGANARRQRPCPADFEDTFIRLGRLECQEHYRAGSRTIARWLEQRGKQRLVEARWAFVVRGRNARAERNRQERLTRADMGRILASAYPPDHRIPATVVRRAAQHLRQIRNGGWIVSPASNGDWWVGSRRRSAAELVELAKAKGFDANLSDWGDVGVGSRR